MGCKRNLQASTICQAEGTSSEGGIDRFSNLPEEVAHHVLSFLNFKDLTRVGALPKRCRQFHISVPVVDFGTNQWTDVKKVDLPGLMSSFDRYLLDRGHNRMQRVCIGLSSYKSETAKKVSDDYSRVLKWIHNAVRCNVEELDLYFIYRVTSMLSLPSFIFHSQSLRSLSVFSGTRTLEIVEAPSLSFSSNLRYLSLSDVKIVDERIFKWISCCCKYLKELSLSSIKGTQNISIESSSLESFSFFNDDDDDDDDNDDCHLNISGEKLENIDMYWGGYEVFESRKSTNSNTSLKIFAPNLKTLKWKGEVRNCQSLGNLKSLEEVEILLEPLKNEFDKVLEVLCSICSAQVLIINDKTIKAVYKEGSKRTLILDNVRNLSIHCESLNNKLVPAVVSLLRRMPNLNIFCIKTRCHRLTPRTASRFGNEYWKLQNLAFIHQLKEVSIENSYGSNEIEFARYILEHAQNLKKMVIVHRDQNAPSKVSGMMSKSKMISAASLLIRQNPKHFYTITYIGPGISHCDFDISDSDSESSDRDSELNS
ncbi:putative F-box protein At3g58860 [Pyrus x bretschneideri]|uniref:putative F-box protein At3g58860 n=1 Tax=Pyrus x bretschneideri TaxID=225117 RepID=UPI0020309943|nr:putative F-box protein At3g58860 [Pyrus x bretschneideri]XP_048428427.1 putative F-box protein At3g58860 [Pyrus x bretschneideri]XP_048428431.1 putative F-box protein At3g58860 [Pyrus x bretschneideri]